MDHLLGRQELHWNIENPSVQLVQFISLENCFHLEKNRMLPSDVCSILFYFDI